jgi:hypothetical protein
LSPLSKNQNSTKTKKANKKTPPSYNVTVFILVSIAKDCVNSKITYYLGLKCHNSYDKKNLGCIFKEKYSNVK